MKTVVLRFAAKFLGLAALLGRKTPHTAAPCFSQLDWDNFGVSDADQAIWEEMVTETGSYTCKDCGGSGNYRWCRDHLCQEECPCQGSQPHCHRCEPLFETCTVCNNDRLVRKTPKEPFVCGSCQKETRYHLGLMKVEKEWERRQAQDKEKKTSVAIAVHMDKVDHAFWAEMSNKVDAACKGSLSDVIDANCKGNDDDLP